MAASVGPFRRASVPVGRNVTSRAGRATDHLKTAGATRTKRVTPDWEEKSPV